MLSPKIRTFFALASSDFKILKSLYANSVSKTFSNSSSKSNSTSAAKSITFPATAILVAVKSLSSDACSFCFKIGTNESAF